MTTSTTPQHQAQIRPTTAMSTPRSRGQGGLQKTTPTVNDPLIFPYGQYTAKCSTQPNVNRAEDTVDPGVPGASSRDEVIGTRRRRQANYDRERTWKRPRRRLFPTSCFGPDCSCCLSRPPCFVMGYVRSRAGYSRLHVRLELLELRGPPYRTTARSFLRAFEYSAAATVIARFIAYPLAYGKKKKSPRLPRRPLQERDAAGVCRSVLHDLPIRPRRETILSDNGVVVNNASAPSAWSPGRSGARHDRAVIAG